jgi:outer membrane receptor protein involved in Fe transport
MHYLSSVAGFVLVAAASFAPFAPVIAAEATDTAKYDLPAQNLETSLNEVRRISGNHIGFDKEAVKGHKAPILKGAFSAEQAVIILLRGSGFHARVTDHSILIERGDKRSEAIQGEPTSADEIVVTGTRIRGTVPAAPVIAATASEIRGAGLNDLGAYVRSLPQSFGGGQNPGVGIAVGGAQNENLNAASALNLRGLGADATLTLLNGHRGPYDGAQQGIDISAIPLATVDRIEIVADGASALYGSDAVGGVANVILKRDFDGVAASGRIGTSTGGGDLQRQAGIVFGSKWSTGGFIAGFDIERTSGIIAGDREITQPLNSSHTLLRPSHRKSATLAAHQLLDSGLTISVDGYYNKRDVSNVVAFGPTLPYLQSGRTGFAQTETFSVAPALQADLAGNWKASLVATYGESKARYGSDIFRGGQALVSQRGCYCNAFRSIELGAEGPIMDLSGGEVRLAFGGGYRENRLRAVRTGAAIQDISARQGAYFAYVEGVVPVIGPSQNIPGIHRLQLTGAMRVEDYPGIERVLTPKLGAVYSLNENLDLRGSWGRSFKAPTLYQLHSPQSAVLDYARFYSSTPVPPDATAIEIAGGNSNLKPERAQTWSVTLAWHPNQLPGLDLEVAYFSTRYRDRVVQPIVYSSRALSDPRYSDLITSDPSDSELAAVLANTQIFNYTDDAYDPSTVAAIIGNAFRNVASQSLRGVDILFRYRHEIGEADDLRIAANVSYLNSNQRLSPMQPVEELSGTIFNPPHLRARQTLTWTGGPSSATVAVSYIGSVSDRRAVLARRVSSMTTVDLAFRHRFAQPRFADLDLSISIGNLLNSRPGLIVTNSPSAEPYDSTNYSIVGRTVNIGATIKW